MRSPFLVFKRDSRDRVTGKSVIRYCVRFFDDDGVVLTKTLKATNKTAAVIETKGLHDRGEGRAKSDPLVIDFLLDFWKIDSTYGKMKALRGRALSIHYVEISAMVVQKHLGERQDDQCRYRRRARGTLSVDEIAKIIELRSESPRVRCAVLLGSLCGLRLGEVRGLEWADIDEAAGMLHVVHNYVDDREGVKGPKCGSRRDVPLPAAVLEAVNLCRACALTYLRMDLCALNHRRIRSRELSLLISSSVRCPMAISVYIARCPQNHPCPAVRVCPVGALTQSGYAAPIVDAGKCIDCGKCVRACPMGALRAS